MITGLRLQRFKSFESATLPMGPFTLLVGANASGKSNLRDAFRFLHGVARGYTVAEVVGEKWAEGGTLQWRGIRGGTREAGFQGAPTFTLAVRFSLLASESPTEAEAAYMIEVDVGDNGKAPRVVKERLKVQGDFVFDSHPDRSPLPLPQPNPALIDVRLRTKARGRPGNATFSNRQPVLSQLIEYPRSTEFIRGAARAALGQFSSMRFLDLSPDAMRLPSIPGHTILGDRGEYLSSVLQAICDDADDKQTLIEWIQELTPMDARDFEFPSDLTGKVLVTLVEESGQRISANSASDGTLRFLAIIAAMLGPDPTTFYFFEELENGIHPARLHLLVQLIEQRVKRGGIQVVATTHSPQLLGLLSPATLEHAVLTYRLQGEPETRARRILDIPEASRLVREQGLGRLHATGWLEDVMTLLSDTEGVE